MDTLFMGIDVAGRSNTWACLIVEQDDGLTLVNGPARRTLAEIVEAATSNEVAAAAVDAQLTYALSEENGFRSSDEQLRALLPAGCRDWVASQNSLMAVPVRGRQLAEALAPRVGTLLETHPRACLQFLLPDQSEAVSGYKKKEDPRRQAWLDALWQGLNAAFSLRGSTPELDDGVIDSTVCALAAWAYHRVPERLRRLNQSASDARGWGPFYVFTR
ncbi:MAG: DUF429 domain-containing protein [Sorangiineae bacterium PRO1]|nr:DUF429 domain-containing protein [Sorangiineae bacterium PRO1]